MRRPHGMLERCSDRGCAHEYSTITIGSDGSRIVTSLLAPAEYLAGMVSTACQAASRNRKRDASESDLIKLYFRRFYHLGPLLGFGFD